MKKLLTLLALTAVLSANASQTQPPFEEIRSAPTAVQLVQWDLDYVEHLVIFKYINPMDATLHLKIYGPQGYLIHVEDLTSSVRQNIGFNLMGMADGTYRVELVSGEHTLEAQSIVLE